MIQTIAEVYKFNLIRIWPNWDHVNPQPDEWIFDEVEEVMSYWDNFGLKVLCGLMFELAPWWLELKYPVHDSPTRKGNRSALAVVRTTSRADDRAFVLTGSRCGRPERNISMNSSKSYHRIDHCLDTIAGTSRILSPHGHATSGHSLRNSSFATVRRPLPLSATG